MTRSVRTTVRVRIKTEVLTTRKKKRLEQIAGRDTRTIKQFLKVIYHNEDQVTSVNKGTKKVSKTKLDHLTLTTTRSTQYPSRSNVRHDLKKRFPRSSHDELQECRDNATAIYHSQQALNSRPNSDTLPKKIPRTQSANRDRFLLASSSNSLARCWVGIRDSLDTNSLDTNKNNTRNHEKLWLPLACSPYHEHRLKQGKIQALEVLYYAKNKEW